MKPKLIIQIPCYNEAKTLPLTLAELPRSVEGFGKVEWLIIDDGSTDGTFEVALRHGVDHLVRFPRNRGLARAFSAGLRECLAQGADVIVNTDGDNQYRAADIPALTRPILAGQADMVVGARPIEAIRHFPFWKKRLQRWGSWLVRFVSHTEVEDATSGFRAFSRSCAITMNVFSNYTYTIETLIQVGRNNFAVENVPVGVNGELRPSRLIRSVPGYLYQSAVTILRMMLIYRPFPAFAFASGLTLSAALGLGVRFLYYYTHGKGGGHLQSLVLSSILCGAGGVLFGTGILADLVSVNRRLMEKIDHRLQGLTTRAQISRATRAAAKSPARRTGTR